MASYSRILLCYNATREGRMALRQGAALALELNAETHLLAVAQKSHAHAYDASRALPLRIACSPWIVRRARIPAEGGRTAYFSLIYNSLDHAVI